jgi:predicted metal-dependent phosphoesterase TrpH
MTTVRAVCHVHSEWSYDGSWTLADLARAFRRRRYDVVLMTEHDIGFTEERWQRYREACADASTDHLLLVPGIEYSDEENCVHIEVWGELPFFGEGLDTTQLLDRVTEFGAFAVLAHPGRGEAWRKLNPSIFAQLSGVEVWNRQYDGWAPSRAALHLANTNRLLPFVGNDFHTARQFFPLAMAIDVREPIVSEHIYEALCERRCRSRAFRVPATRVVNGLPGAALRGAERVRRPLARAVRSSLHRG